MDDCKSKTILGILLEAILKEDGKEIKRIKGLIGEGGKFAQEFYAEIKKANSDIIKALKVKVPELINF